MTLENCKKFFSKGEKQTEMDTTKACDISKWKAQYEKEQKK
jgi:hypothetical protein